MSRKSVTFIHDSLKTETGGTAVFRKAVPPALPEYMGVHGPACAMQTMSLRDVYYCAEGSSCDPPGELNTYESEYDAYPYEIASIPSQHQYRNACHQPEGYASVRSQSDTGAHCSKADFGSSRTQYIHHNSSKPFNGKNHLLSSSESVRANSRIDTQPMYNAPLTQPNYTNTNGQGNRRLPSSPHPCRQQENYYNSSQTTEHVRYQRELLNELIRLKREIHDKDANSSCSGNFVYFIKTAFCQVENLAARRRKHLSEAIGDVARSKTLLEFELRQQLIDIEKQRLEMEERFQREIHKQISEKVAREAQLESMLLDQMEGCVKLEMHLSGLDLIEESRLRMLSPTAQQTPASRGSPPDVNTTAVSSVRAACVEMDEKNIQPETSQQVVTKLEKPGVKNYSPGMQSNEDDAKSQRQEIDKHKEPMRPTVSMPGVLKDAVSEPAKSSSQKVSFFNLSKNLAKSNQDESSVGSKPYRVLSFLLCHSGTLGLEVQQRQDASLSAVVARVVPDSQAHEAGVRKGDLLCHADSDTEFSYHEFLRLAKSGIRPLRFNVRRVESSAPKGNVAKSEIVAMKKKKSGVSLPNAQNDQDKVSLPHVPEVAAVTDRPNQKDSKHHAKPMGICGRFNKNETEKGVEVVKTDNERKSGLINSSDKGTCEHVIPSTPMSEIRRDTSLKPSLLLFTNDLDLAKVKQKKQDPNKENAGCKPCLHVQTSSLSEFSSPKLPFSVANLNSPESSSKQKSDAAFKIFSPTHCHSPNASSFKEVSFSSNKSNHTEKTPGSSQMPRINRTVSVNEQKNRSHKSYDIKVTLAASSRGVIDVE